MFARCLMPVVVLIVGSVDAADSAPGIVAEMPQSGRFVKTDIGYMVPYDVEIPGTGRSFRMQPIPPGKFTMGSPVSEKGRQSIEGPQLNVRVDPFWMAECEVTQGEYRNYMATYSIFREFKYKGLVKVTEENQVDAVTAPTTLYEPSLIFENGDHEDMPMITMTLFAAKQYSKWLSGLTGSEFRLPTEAEWEYACRAGSTTAYHFGDDPQQLGEYAWFRGNSYNEGLRKVGTRKPNAWGLFDMHGSVAEWVHDHCAAYKVTSPEITAASDWVRTDKRDPKSVRGGSWLHAADECRSAFRLPSDHEAWNEYDPDLPRSPWWLTSGESIGVGFRVVRPLKKMSTGEQQEFWGPSNEETQLDVTDRLKDGRGAIGIVVPELAEALRTTTEKLRSKD